VKPSLKNIIDKGEREEKKAIHLKYGIVESMIYRMRLTLVGKPADTREF
jgi:hypothetical protein